MAGYRHVASKSDPKKIRKLIGTDKSHVNDQDSDGKTALHFAAAHGLVGAVEELLTAGAKLDVIDSQGMTPLMTATEDRSAEIMEKLLAPRPKNGKPAESQLEIYSNLGWTPLLCASITGFSEGVKLLIQAGADCNAITHDSRSTALISASSWGYREIVEMLLDTTNPNGRAKVNVRDVDGGTALHAAVIDERYEITSSLVGLLADADVDVADESGQTALHIASTGGHQSIVELLLEKDPTADELNKESLTPLHLAIKALGDVQNELALDQFGSGLHDFKSRAIEDRHNAELRSDHYVEIIQLLLNHGAKPETRTTEKDTALHLAAACGEPACLKAIMEQMEEDMLSPNDNNETALSSILQLKGQRRATAMRILLSSNSVKVADFGQEHTWNSTLDWAANDDKFHDIAQLLMLKKPRKYSKPPTGSESWTAIMWAAYEQLPQVLSLLISTSPRSSATEEALSSALESTLKLVNEADNKRATEQLPLVLWLLITASKRTYKISQWLEEASTKLEALQKGSHSIPSTQKLRKRDPKNDTPKQKRKTDKEITGTEEQQTGLEQKFFESKHVETLKDILCDPPFARVHKEPKHYDIPSPEEKFRNLLNYFEANIVQFFGVGSISKTVQATRRVHEVIYGAGPTKAMRTGIAMQKAVARLDGDVGDNDPDFTWVHLPATNMDWMNMPYFCFSVNLDEDHGNFQTAKKMYESLLKEYSESTVHGSPTLDEWYYHFAKGDDEAAKDRLVRNKSQVVTEYLNGGRKSEQNEYNHGSSASTSSSGELALLRVNQVWIWTIGKKWLITANSCLFDNGNDTLVQGLLDQLSTQAQYGGRMSQPGSADEMSRLIVEYCIASYERRPESERQWAVNETCFTKAGCPPEEQQKPVVLEIKGQSGCNNISSTATDSFNGQVKTLSNKSGGHRSVDKTFPAKTGASDGQKKTLAVQKLSIGQIYSNHMNRIVHMLF
ncbi:hypothetical protein CLIM01_00749 [Colletotrichum limetticola]|uniref:Ankyrin repeat protein n=1 Tax=Colletotrichum limetticola TaxID=1209924 RepID=A0ABQ9QDR4_9PEZI|nr:hypothetical protein CLIM01_00749 [Colletotrichum limetticola]